MAFRFKELKSHLNKSSNEMAGDLKVSPSTVSSWLSGRRTPRLSQIMIIEDVYHLNRGWLTGKTDQMFPDTTDNDRRKQVKELMTCQSEFAVNTVTRLAEASDSEWKVLEKFLK